MIRNVELRGFGIAAFAATVVLAFIGGLLDAAEPTGELVGTVVDLDGRPIPKAKLWLEGRRVHSKTIATAETSPDGRFRIGPIARVCDARLLIDAPGFGREHREGVSIFSNATNQLRIVLAPGRTVRGGVLTVDGQPAVDVAVTFYLRRIVTGRVVSEDIGREGQVTTDSRGQFRVHDVPPCEFCVEVRIPKGAIGWLREDIQPGSALHTLQTLRMSPDVPIAGVVHDSKGTPLANITVGTNFVDGPATVKTDALGEFLLRGFPADQISRVRLEISAPGFARAVVPVGDNRSRLTVVLKQQRWIIGRVIDAETGAPVTINSLVLCPLARRANGEIYYLNCAPVPFEQPEKGQFRVPYDTPHGYHVTVVAAGFDHAEALVESPQKYEDIEGIVIKARHNGSKVAADVVPVPKIVGTLTRDGQPVSSAWVSAARMRTEFKLPNAFIRRGRTVAAEPWVPRSVASSSAGVYSLDVTDQGRWYVLIEEPNRAATLRGPFELKLNQKLNLDVGLSEGGTITGRVRGIPSNSAGYWWLVAFDRTVLRAESRVAKDGMFRLDHLPAGEYGLKVGHDGYRDADVPDRPSTTDLKREANPWHGATLVRVAPGQMVADVLVDLQTAKPLAQAAQPSKPGSNK